MRVQLASARVENADVRQRQGLVAQVVAHILRAMLRVEVLLPEEEMRAEHRAAHPVDKQTRRERKEGGNGVRWGAPA